MTEICVQFLLMWYFAYFFEIFSCSCVNLSHNHDLAIWGCLFAVIKWFNRFMKKERVLDDPSNVAVIFLGILVLPFLLWIIERVLPYPVLVEELTKLLIVLAITKRVKENLFYWIVLAGLMFGIAESFLYLININLYGSLTVWWSRLLLTVPMHVITISIIYGLGKFGRFGLAVGLILAIFVHYEFNLLVR